MLILKSWFNSLHFKVRPTIKIWWKKIHKKRMKLVQILWTPCCRLLSTAFSHFGHHAYILSSSTQNVAREVVWFRCEILSTMPDCLAPPLPKDQMQTMTFEVSLLFTNKRGIMQLQLCSATDKATKDRENFSELTSCAMYRTKYPPKSRNSVEPPGRKA